MTKSSATKGCHSTIHLSIIVVHHHCTPFGFLCRASSSMFPPLTHLLHHSTSFPLSTMCTISFHLLALIDSPLTHLSTHAMHNHPCPLHAPDFLHSFHAPLHSLHFITVHHPCLLHYFWFHSSIHWIITLNCCTLLVPFTHQISYNFYLHYMHSLMHHPPPLESHVVHHDSCCTFDSFLHHSTSLSFLYHVHNHSCSLAATPLHFTPMLCIITSLSPLNHFKHHSLHSIATPLHVPLHCHALPL